MVLTRASSRSPREVLTTPADKTARCFVAVDDEACPRPERHATEASAGNIRYRHVHVKPTIGPPCTGRLRAPERRGQNQGELASRGRVCPISGTRMPSPGRAPLCGILVAVMLNTTNTSTATVRERKAR